MQAVRVPSPGERGRAGRDLRGGVRARSPAQSRIVAAALDLFGRYGVSGTSLQMIADTVGVTKAAVYHQYKTKEEIVIAVMEDDLRRLEAALDIAEAEEGPRAREVLLTLVIDLAVQRRRIVSALQQDPVIIGLLASARAVPGAHGPPVRGADRWRHERVGSACGVR